MKLALGLLALVALAGVAAPAAPVTIGANPFAYVLPVAHVTSGQSVVWTSSDTVHVTSEGASLGDADPCFFVVHAPGEDSEAVRFDLADGAVHATQEGLTTECLNARVAPGGASAAVPFYCILHPTMRGTLVVTAA